MLLRKSHRKVPFWDGKTTKKYPTGYHTLGNGNRIFATETQIIHLNDSDQPNGKSADNSLASVTLVASTEELRDVLRHIPKEESIKNADFIQAWVKHRNINPHLEAEARSAWRLCRELTKNRPLNKLTKDDGRKLAQELLNKNSLATVAKKIGHLRAAANLALDDRKIEFNPFERVMPKYNKRNSRRFLDDDDMTLIRTHLSKLSDDDQLLWKMLAYTGMRLGEPFHITEEFRENGVRYVKVGSKTDTSIRRVPIPTELLRHFPERIQDRVFPGKPEIAGKRLRYFLRKLSISYDQKRGTGDRKKVIHSLRHRAKDKLRSLGCPRDIQNEILGHDKRTVSDHYGVGYPIEKLLYWVDQISY